MIAILLITIGAITALVVGALAFYLLFRAGEPSPDATQGDASGVEEQKDAPEPVERKIFNRAIFLKMPSTGVTKSIDFADTETAIELKSRVLKEAQISIERQTLLCGSQLIKDDDLLGDYQERITIRVMN